MRKNSALVLSVLLAAGSVPGARAFEFKGPKLGDDPGLEKIRELRWEISLLNLLNGLYLSDDQLGELIALADKAESTKRSFRKRASSRAGAYTRDLLTLKEALYTPTGPGKDVKQAALRKEVEIELRPKAEAAEKLGKLEDRARGVLTEGQNATIAGFKPCLIPPKSLADPVAVGQAVTTEKEEAALDVVRRMPKELYAKRRKKIVRAMVAQGEKEKGKMPADVRGGMERTLLKKLDSVRAMSEVDFGLKQHELGRSFLLFDDDVTYRKGRMRQLGKISKWLLNADAAQVMRRYRRSMADAPARTRLDAELNASPAKRHDRIEQMLAKRYGRVAMALFHERFEMGRLGDQDSRRMRQDMMRIREIESPSKRFAAIDRVVRRLNTLYITESSVNSMYLKVAYLCHQKRLRGVVHPRRGKARRPRPRKQLDVTGLSELVKKAEGLHEDERFRDAYRVLNQVATYVKAFKD